MLEVNNAFTGMKKEELTGQREGDRSSYQVQCLQFVKSTGRNLKKLTEGTEVLTPDILGITNKCLKPTSRKSMRALASDIVSTTVYGEALVNGCRSKNISISSSVNRSSSILSPLPEPLSAKSPAENSFKASMLVGTGADMKAFFFSNSIR
jgi:hypothetical protein